MGPAPPALLASTPETSVDAGALALALFGGAAILVGDDSVERKATDDQMRAAGGQSAETSGATPLGRGDYLAALALVLVALALRAPFRSQFAYHWDSAQFTLAIRQYDMRLSQPHAPGYFLYVMLGRLVNRLVGDPHASLVWISVVFGSALPAIVYLLGTAMFGRWTGATAGLLALTSPQIWFHSCVALTYVVDSFLVCAMVLLLWRAMRRGGQWGHAVVVGTLLAVVGGVREQSALALAPLVLFAFWRFERARVAKLAVVAVVSVSLGALWFVPMVRTSGGLGTYLEIVRLNAAADASGSSLGGVLYARLKNLANITGFCWNGLVLGAVTLVGAHLYRMFWMTDEQKRVWGNQRALALAVLVMWIVPMMGLGTVIVTDQPGHVLSYLPGWFVLIGVVVASLKGEGQRVATIFAICAMNIVAFVAWPPHWDVVFFRMARTAREIAEHDAQLSRIVATVRQSYSPKEVIICHADEYFLCGLRHFQLYLPEYKQYQLAIDITTPHPPGKPMWQVRDGRLEFVDKLDMDGYKQLVLLVPPGENVEIFAPYLPLAGVKVLTRDTNHLYFLPAAAVKSLR
jgi:hypothetical protein